MLAYISLLQLTPLIGISRSDEILYQLDFDTIVQHGDKDIMSYALDLYINSTDRSQYYQHNIDITKFDTALGLINHKLYEMSYPAINIESITTPDALRFVVDNMDRIRCKVYYCAEIYGEESCQYASISHQLIWNTIIKYSNTDLMLAMLEYNDRECYKYMLDIDLLYWFIENDPQFFKSIHTPITVEEFDILDKAGYNFNINYDLGEDCLCLCEDNLDKGSLVLIKLLEWEDKEGNKYKFNYDPDEWLPQIVELVSKYR